MMIISLLLFAPWIALCAAQEFFTGFNYGAFWSEQSNPKLQADFADGFKLARTLNTSIPFDSARLFTCIATGTVKDPTGAFDAAVETGTYLLLGFWISGGENGSPTALVSNEMSALEQGFQKHGQALADLVIGLSVGNEDIYRFTNEQPGAEASLVADTIQKVRELIAKSSFATYMKDISIGHIDTAPYAVVDGADFAGMTAYPYWNKESIEEAKKSFFGSLEEVKKRAGDVPVWIAEMGWPFEGAQQGAAVATLDNMQKYWTEVGCEVFGKYNTFWFQLLRDSTSDQPDWALIDATTHQPRIKNLMCPEGSPVASTEPSTPPSSSAPIAVKTSQLSENAPMTPKYATGASDFRYPTPTSIISVAKSPAPAPISALVSDSSNAPSLTSKISEATNAINPSIVSSSTLNSIKGTTTVIVTQTITITPPATPQASTLCVTVADVSHNNVFATLTSGPPDPDGKCGPAPDFTGYPYVNTVTSHVPSSTTLPTTGPWNSSPSTSPMSVSTNSSLPVTSSEKYSNPSTPASTTAASQETKPSTPTAVSSSIPTSTQVQSSSGYSSSVPSPASQTSHPALASSNSAPSSPQASSPPNSNIDSRSSAQTSSRLPPQPSSNTPVPPPVGSPLSARPGSPLNSSPNTPLAPSSPPRRSNPGDSPSGTRPGVKYTVTSDAFPISSSHVVGPPPRTPAPPTSFDAPIYTGTKDVNPAIQSHEISLAHNPVPSVSRSLPSGRHDPGTMHNPGDTRVAEQEVQAQTVPAVRGPVGRDMSESMTKIVRRGVEGRYTHIPVQSTSERENAEYKLRAEKNGAGMRPGQSAWLRGLVGLAWA